MKKNPSITSSLSLIFSCGLFVASCGETAIDRTLEDSLSEGLFQVRKLFVEPIVDGVLAIKNSSGLIGLSGLEAINITTDSDDLDVHSDEEKARSNKYSGLAINSNSFDLTRNNLSSCAEYIQTMAQLEAKEKTKALALNNAFSWTSNSAVPLYLLGEYSYISSFTRSCEFLKQVTLISEIELQNKKPLEDGKKSKAELSLQIVANTKSQTLEIKDFDLPDMNVTKLGDIAKQKSIRFVRAYQTTNLVGNSFFITIEHELQVRPLRQHDSTHYFDPNKTLLQQNQDNLYLQQRFTLVMTDMSSGVSNVNRQLVGVFSNYKYNKSCQYQVSEEKTDYSHYALQADSSGVLQCVGGNISIEDLSTDTMTYAAVMDKENNATYVKKSICSTSTQVGSFYKPLLCKSEYVHKDVYINTKQHNTEANREAIRDALFQAMGKINYQMAQYSDNQQFPATIQEAAILFGVLSDVNVVDMQPEKLTEKKKKNSAIDAINPNLFIQDLNSNADGHSATISWLKIPDSDSYNVYFAQESFKAVDNMASQYYTVRGGKVLQGQASPRTMHELEVGRQYYFVLTSIYKGIETRSAERSITITLPPPELVTAIQKNYFLPVGTTIRPIMFNNIGGNLSPGGCSISPALPQGLVVEVLENNCIISGTPTEERTQKGYTVTAKNSGGVNNSPVIKIAIDFPKTTGLSIHAVYIKTITLKWNANPAAQVYYLYESVAPAYDFSVIAELGKETTSYEQYLPLWLYTKARYYLKSCYSTQQITCESSNIATMSPGHINSAIGRIKRIRAGLQGFGQADKYGANVSISSDTIASAAMGTNNSRGEVSILRLQTGSKWGVSSVIRASNADPDDLFGSALAIEGDTLAIGAFREDSNAKGVGGDELSNTNTDSGAVYVFKRTTSGDWTQDAYIKASNSGLGDEFGGSLSLNGGTLVVGAAKEDGASQGIGGDELSNTNTASGAVYVFKRTTSGDWTQDAYIKASNPDRYDSFGGSLSLSGDTLIVGAAKEDGASTGIGGDALSNTSVDSGAVYIFKRDTSGNWSQQVYIKSDVSAANDQFGSSLSLDGDVLVVGAPNEDSSGAIDSGAVHLFHRVNATWSKARTFKASNIASDDNFGMSVSLKQGTFVVGAPNEGSDGVGIDGSQSTKTSKSSGAVYVFTRDRKGDWNQRAYMKDIDTRDNTWFGHSLSVGSQGIVVGAIQENGGGTMDLSGSVYIF